MSRLFTHVFKNKFAMMILTSFGLFTPTLVMAQDVNSGDTAWMLTATALVLFMTIPGLSLFYAGMVRSKNVLSVMMQCFTITCMISVLWMIYGYPPKFGRMASRAVKNKYVILKCIFAVG